jgi:cholesterol transport system auxiliary component
MKTPLILIAMLPLAGCISFGAKPPPTLLTLTSASQVPVGQNQDSATAKSISIQVPTTPMALATARVPVQATPTSIAYVPDAQWSEPPARLFARLSSDTIAARTGLVVLSTIQSVGDPSAQLAGELRNFGLDATTREAVVTFDASLTRQGKTTVEKHRFEARVPVTAIDAPSAAAGINQAANQVATELADWISR